MAILQQIDSSDTRGVSDDLVGFVELSQPAAGQESWWTGERYSGYIQRRPIRVQEPPLARCPHEHREVDAAVRCVTRLLRQHSREGAK